MRLAEVDRSILVLIDLQGKLAEIVHRAESVRRVSCRLLELAGMFEVPVVLTEQYPRGLGHTHPEVLEAYEKLEVPKRRLEKVSFGCCGDPGFEAALAELRPGLAPDERQLIIGGIEAHICVMQTVLEALADGNRVQVCWDATSGRGVEHRQWALERMQQAGAAITNHESVAFEWARDKNHPQFKAMSSLMKEGQLVD